MADSSVTDAEILFFEELTRRKVKFMVVGMSAAVIQGADLGTEDIDLWFKSLSDLVIHCDGLRSFDAEYASAVDADVFGVKVKVLPLRRVIASKEAANRLKGQAVIPALKAALAAIRKTRSKT